ncbi:MAG: pyruvate dehydrogenase (acetyl-transferring) E1 component subunit alpha [Candidatus Hodarchaeales archaeon]|jgi:2-oxoisovalerate dehydrogenase E1 component alpha subunit
MRQILSSKGEISVDSKFDPDSIPRDELVSMYKLMVQVRLLDEKGIRLQRQGRIGFYVPSTGQEATQIGLATALRRNDWVFPSYREIGIVFQRGIAIQQVVDQWFGNINDTHKGRRLSCLAGVREVDFVNPSAPIGTQIIQAAGVGHAMNYKKEKKVCAVFFGDGATSSNDFHSGMNFASVFKSPTIFFCQNNQWAISVPLSRQTASESIVIKAEGYGMPGEQIDGNDIFAVYTAVKEAADKARKGEGPSFIEAITMRMGAHTTSDDPSRYREEKGKVMNKWREQDPIKRLKLFLESKKLWDDNKEIKWHEKISKDLDEAVDKAEAAGPPDIETIFTDVFQEMPWHLKEQLEELKEFKRKYE